MVRRAGKNEFRNFGHTGLDAILNSGVRRGLLARPRPTAHKMNFGSRTWNARCRCTALLVPENLALPTFREEHHSRCGNYCACTRRCGKSHAMISATMAASNRIATLPGRRETSRRAEILPARTVDSER